MNQSNIQAFFSLLEYAPVGVFVIDSDYHVLFWNTCLENWSGISRDDIVNTIISDRFDYFKTTLIKTRLKEIFIGGAPIIFSSQLHQYMVPARLPNGDFRIQNTTVSAICNPDNEDQFLAIFYIQDITELSQRVTDFRMMRDKALQEVEERKKIEKALKKAKNIAEKANKIKSQFLANVTHELRTPLHVIIGTSDILLKYQPIKQLKDVYNSIDMIFKSSQRLLDLVNDILDISKLQSHKMTVIPEVFPISDLLVGLKETMTHLLGTKQVRFYMDAPARIGDLLNIETFIKTDKSKMIQLITNLLSNAAKFTSTGEIRLIIYKQNDQLFFKVKDTGIGIPKDKLHTVFDDFTQVDNELSRRYKGTGLGLSICKKIVELLKGQLAVESVLGQGSAFTFWIPYEKGDSIQPISSEQNLIEDLDLTVLKSIKILICDDDMFNLNFVELILQNKIQYVLAETAHKAIEKAESEKFDLIFMDIQMPELDGKQALKSIRQISLNADTPIIALTAHAMKDVKKDLIKAGFNGYLSKPFKANDLLGYLVNFFKH